MLLVYKEHCLFIDGYKQVVIEERLMAIAVRKAKRMGIFVRVMKDV